MDVYRFREATGRFSWVPARIRLFRLLRRWSRGGEIDLIEVPDYGGPAAGWPSLPVPVVARLSGSGSFFAAEMGRSLTRSYYVELASLRRADYWCSESRYMAEKTRELYKMSTPPDAILYNPVTLPPAGDEKARSAVRVVFAGTLTVKKGIVSLLAAWPKVLAGFPAAELHIWGKDGRTEDGGSMRARLEADIPPEWASTVHFHGHIALDDLLAQFHTARLAVLPSFAEGFALTPLHAMAAGCPTVYTTRGSGPELIQEGKTGLLVDPASPDEISGAILRLLLNGDLAARLGRAGRRHIAENFSLDTLIQKNEAFYDECLRRFDARSASRAVAS